MASLSALPHETLLNIMLSPQLDYRDLKCLARVCKTLNRLEKDPQLDAKMFRKRLPPNRSEKVILAKVEDSHRNCHHPILDYVELTSSSMDELVASLAMKPHHWNQIKLQKPIEYAKLPCMNEFATSPPCRKIVWSGLAEEEEEFLVATERATGVRVKHVLNDMFKMWHRKIPQWYREYHARKIEDSMGDESFRCDKPPWGEGSEGPDAEWDINEALRREISDTMPTIWAETRDGVIGELSSKVTRRDCVTITVLKWAYKLPIRMGR